MPEIEEIAAGSFRRKEPPEIQGIGCVVRSPEAELWAFYKGDNIRDGRLLTATLGDDADTTAAVYGQLAGAYHGEPGIPQSWLEKLALRDAIASFAGRHYAGSQREPARVHPFASVVRKAKGRSRRRRRSNDLTGLCPASSWPGLSRRRGSRKGGR